MNAEDLSKSVYSFLSYPSPIVLMVIFQANLVCLIFLLHLLPARSSPQEKSKLFHILFDSVQLCLLWIELSCSINLHCYKAFHPTGPVGITPKLTCRYKNEQTSEQNWSLEQHSRGQTLENRPTDPVPGCQIC